MCAEAQITHLIYADDLLMFARADSSTLMEISRCLEDFGDKAGLRANPLKSNLYMAGVDDRVKSDLLRITGFQEGTFPFRYLGIPLAAEKLRISDYGPLLDAVSRKIISWPKHTLSYAGRLELVRSVLQGVECYWLSILPLPCGVVAKLYGICRSFVWSTKHPPISWAKLCRQKEEGGYQLRDLKAWNNALLCRNLWNIQSKADSLWVRWVHHHYLKHGEFWHWTSKASDSPLIKKLAQIRDQIIARTGGLGAANMLLIDWFAADTQGTGAAYRFFSPRGTVVHWAGAVWRPGIMPKHRFTYWLLAHGNLRTADRMPYEPRKDCSLCQLQEESNGHIFFRCTVTRRLWDMVRTWLGIRPEIHSVGRLFHAFKRELRGKGRMTKARHLAITCMIFLLWQTRNRCRFEGDVPKIERMFLKIQTHVYRFIDI